MPFIGRPDLFRGPFAKQRIHVENAAFPVLKNKQKCRVLAGFDTEDIQKYFHKKFKYNKKSRTFYRPAFGVCRKDLYNRLEERFAFPVRFSGPPS
jgi:hypothetical protein